QNETIAFVGESGSGKTTIINLIISLLTPNKGNILIDGVDSGTIQKESYRRRIGYICQDPVIFNDTIFNNVTMWDSPTEANHIRFKKVMEQTSLTKFIAELSAQENTLLGNNGINISGGQKQRISIARELYKDVDILVLDEATSALDSETEKNIQDQINELQGKLTILIVAHRLSTIRNANKVVMLEQGQIVDINSFEGLQDTSPRFKQMVSLQAFNN